MSYKLAQAIDALPKKDKPKTRADVLALTPEKVYDDGKTIESFQGETDINRLLARAQRSGTLSWLEKHADNIDNYGEAPGLSLLEAQLRIRRGREAFDELPSEIRREFRNSPLDFYKYVHDPENRDNLAQKLPALAKPGRQNIDASGKSDPRSERDIAAEAAEASVASETTATEDPT